jgi:hypothetical protein
MGNYCSCVCNSAADGKLQEIEDVKRERIKIKNDYVDFDSMSICSYSLPTYSTMSSELILKSAARQYLTCKCIKIAKVFNNFTLPCQVICEPPPTAEEIMMIEKEIPQIRPPAVKDPSNLVFMPTVKMQDGCFYEGQWNLANEQPEGFGTMVHNDQSKYVGYFKDGRKSGLGRLIKIDGDFFEGTFKSDLFHGQGILIKPCKNYPTSLISEMGIFTSDSELQLFENYAKTVKSEVYHCYKPREKHQQKKQKEHSEGTIEWQGYVIYSGNFWKGMKHGLGKMCFSDGSYYDGEFSANMMDGKGEYAWADGKKYCGFWKTSRPHGEGVYSWPDGREYKGAYANGFRDGC